MLKKSLLLAALAIALFAGSITTICYMLPSFKVAPEPPHTRDAQRRQLINGIRTQIEHPDGNRNLSPEDIERLKARLRELEAGRD